MKEKLPELKIGDIVRIVFDGTADFNKIARIVHIDISNTKKYQIKILDTGMVTHYGRRDSFQKIETIKVKFKLPKCYG